MSKDMMAMLPDMSDVDLKTLLGNAERLATGGSDKQKTAAAALLPAIAAERDRRQAEKIAARPKRPSRKQT